MGKYKTLSQPLNLRKEGSESRFWRDEVSCILILSLVHSLPWNEVNYVYDFGFIPVASHGVFAERE
ncbi:MAG: hypothetical protein Q8O30_01950 [Candidatus Omnitrophota bacterium]|nr:hypothetical protein [Candidatus Omnitrophota bacterium]